MTYDVDRSRIILFGGECEPSNPGVEEPELLHDTWEAPGAVAGPIAMNMTVNPDAIKIGSPGVQGVAVEFDIPSQTVETPHQLYFSPEPGNVRPLKVSTIPPGTTHVSQFVDRADLKVLANLFGLTPPVTVAIVTSLGNASVPLNLLP